MYAALTQHGKGAGGVVFRPKMAENPKKRGLDPQLELGKRLKAIILKAGYHSVEKFALENGFDRVTIYRIVEKGADPKLSMVIRIINALDIEPNQLLR